MAICLRKQGKTEEAARFLFRAMQLEPGKFYHHKDFGMALLELGDRNQAIKMLENANKLFKNEHGKNHSKIIAAIEEARTMPEGERVVFEEPTSSVTAICYGVITKYLSERGFGFIKDNKDGKDVFFHIKSIKPRVTPEEGMSVKFLREIGEKSLRDKTGIFGMDKNTLKAAAKKASGVSMKRRGIIRYDGEKKETEFGPSACRPRKDVD